MSLGFNSARLELRAQLRMSFVVERGKTSKRHGNDRAVSPSGPIKPFTPLQYQTQVKFWIPLLISLGCVG